MKKISLLVCAVGCASSFHAQNLMQPETLWDFTRIVEHVVSPDGKNVVFAASTYSIVDNKGNTELYVIPVSGGTPVNVTNTLTSESNPRWRPDGMKIGYVSSESGTPQVYEINPDGTGKRQVTNLADGVSNFNYSPGGLYIYFTQDVKTGVTVADIYPDLPKANARIIDGLMYRHWNYWEDEFSSHVFYMKYSDGTVVVPDPVDIMAGEPYDAPLAPFGGEEQLNWSPDAAFIAYTSKKLTGTEYATSTNSEIYLYKLSDKSTENLSEGNLGYDIEPRFSPDGRYIAWLSMETPGFEADKSRLVLYDLAKKEKKDLTDGFDQNAANPIWSKDSKYIYFSSATKGTNQLYQVEIQTAKITQLTEGIHDLTAFDLAGDVKNPYLITTRTTMSSPAELWKVNVKNNKMDQLTFLNKPVLDSLKLATVEQRWIKTTDGKEMLVWVIFPPDFDKTKKYPTLLYCQGGPQSMVSQSFSYRWNFQLMAANGYIIVAPNRRGLPGFGQEWNDEISGDWGGQAMQDMLTAIDEVSKEPYVDTERRGAIGASFGGYNVYWLAGNHEGRFKSFISHCGVFNFSSMYGHTEEVFFSNHDFGGSYWESPELLTYNKFSPHLFVQNWDTPILVIHNERDFRVPLSEGMQAFTAAQLKGVKSRFLYFEDEGHWVTRPQNSILWQRVFFDWLKETL